MKIRYPAKLQIVWYYSRCCIAYFVPYIFISLYPNHAFVISYIYFFSLLLFEGWIYGWVTKEVPSIQHAAVSAKWEVIYKDFFFSLVFFGKRATAGYFNKRQYQESWCMKQLITWRTRKQQFSKRQKKERPISQEKEKVYIPRKEDSSRLLFLNNSPLQCATV